MPVHLDMEKEKKRGGMDGGIIAQRETSQKMKKKDTKISKLVAVMKTGEIIPYQKHKKI
jgi:hypothetical protein